MSLHSSTRGRRLWALGWTPQEVEDVVVNKRIEPNTALYLGALPQERVIDGSIGRFGYAIVRPAVKYQRVTSVPVVATVLICELGPHHQYITRKLRVNSVVNAW